MKKQPVKRKLSQVTEVMCQSIAETPSRLVFLIDLDEVRLEVEHFKAENPESGDDRYLVGFLLRQLGEMIIESPDFLDREWFAYPVFPRSHARPAKNPTGKDLERPLGTLFIEHGHLSGAKMQLVAPTTKTRQ